MDYVYMAVAFGRHTLDAAKAISPVSPVPDAATLRQMLKPHKHWLTRDRRGLSPTSDLEGCFETGPGRFFPGRFRGGGATGVRRAVAAEGSAGGAARRLLRLAAGQPMSLAKAYETLQEVSEPHRRLLCGRLGAFMPPEVFVAADGGPAGMVQKAAVFLVLDVEEVGEVGTLEVEMGHRASHRGGKSESIGSPFHPATAAGGARASAVAQLLFAAPTVSAAKGVRGGYEALQELQRNAGKPLEARRQVLRQLLRSWHPDKHQSASLQQQEEAAGDDSGGRVWSSRAWF
eukprot:g4106.t1